MAQVSGGESPVATAAVAAVRGSTDAAAGVVAVSSPSSVSSDTSSGDRVTDSSGTSDADLALAVSLSKRQHEEDEQRRLKQEEELLQQILQLSLSEK